PGYEWLKEIFLSEKGQLRIEKVRQLTTIAEELGTSITLIAIAWCLKNPNVSSVILGASRSEQLKENLTSLQVVDRLTEEVMGKIEAVLARQP
ncbi:MAG: aldo/keto reductase, partial [Calditrichae bacterium]|nr:aldo/keto reductase [Calditrichia bacterium]